MLYECELSSFHNDYRLELTILSLSEQLNTELAHFLLELVQNADDLKYQPGTRPSLTFRLIGNHLLVVSNETGFKERDVESICSVGDSTKVGIEDTTGEKGIGFKSLFKAAEEVTIASNGFHFQFSLNRPCGSVVPEWKELPQEFRLPQNSDKTIFLLSFANHSKLAKVRQELLSFDEKLLLFLRRLRSVEIEIDGKITRVVRQDTTNNGKHVTTLSTRGNQSQSSTFEYAIVPFACPVTVRDEARKNRQTSIVTLAFPLGRLQGDCQAYNCLPICKTGYPFLLQGDFILSASREGLNETHSGWNDMLFHGLAEAFLHAVKRFNADPALRYSWLKYLPRKSAFSQFKNLSILIQARLKREHVLSTQIGGLCIPSSAFYVPREWRDEENNPLIQIPSFTPANLSTKYDDGLTKELEWLGGKTPNRMELFRRFQQYLSWDNGKVFQSQPVSRLSRFAEALISYYHSDLETLPIIPIKDGRWVATKGRILFFSQTDNQESSTFDMPRGLPEVDVLLPKYVSSSKSLKALFEKLDVKQGTVPEICKMIEEAHANATPPSSEPEVLIEHALYLFNAWHAKKYMQSVGGFKPMWLCTETGKAVLSRFMYQPAAFVNQSILEYIGRGPKSRRLMHPGYLANIALSSSDEFSEWLATHWKVFTWLRICKISDRGKPTLYPTREFQLLLSHQNCDEFLELLVNSWHQNFGTSSPPSFIANIGLMKAAWASNKSEEVSLKDTFLPSKAIKDIAPPDVPFLRVSNPEDRKWHVLRSLDVVVTTEPDDADFWLSCLRPLMKDQPNKETILRIYENLNRLCARQSSTIG
jgi:hypothetical protein